MEEKYIIDSLKFFQKMMDIPGTAGYCKDVRNFIQNELEGMGVKIESNNKGQSILELKVKILAKQL